MIYFSRHKAAASKSFTTEYKNYALIKLSSAAVATSSVFP